MEISDFFFFLETNFQVMIFSWIILLDIQFHANEYALFQGWILNVANKLVLPLLPYKSIIAWYIHDCMYTTSTTV